MAADDPSSKISPWARGENLRHVEKEVLIPKIVREKAKAKCDDFVKGKLQLEFEIANKVSIVPVKVIIFLDSGVLTEIFTFRENILKSMGGNELEQSQHAYAGCLNGHCKTHADCTLRCCHLHHWELPRGGVLPKKMGRGVRPASQNPYPIYE